jgi:anti-sigma regulatory factor (Ser/Thr protein kinase)
VSELFAAGMPLGLMPGMPYDESEAVMAPGDGLLIYSDGLVEAHNPEREMFGFPRLRDLLARRVEEAIPVSGSGVIDFLIQELAEFTGPGWEQEDDVTFVTLEHTAAHPSLASQVLPAGASEEPWQVLAEFSLASEPGNEIQAMNLVADLVAELDLPQASMERLKTAVAEATMNAIEHGNKYQEDLPVEIEVLANKQALSVRITDHGGGQTIPDPETPDLEAKLAGDQSPRGWGLFLIKNMVDEMNVLVGGPEHGGVHHTLELIFKRKGSDHVATGV